MPAPRFVSFAEADRQLDWIAATDAIAAGHKLPRAEVSDSFLYNGPNTVLNRAAWIKGLGIAVKTATIFPGNAPDPVVNGGVSVFADETGTLEAIVDFHLLTKWKTAADSLLAARRLARPDSRRIVILGAGTVARSMLDAYRAVFPKAQTAIWNRTLTRAAGIPGVTVVEDLEPAVRQADIICCATMATDPVLPGAWIPEGCHVDLIGAYRPDMRETDDTALARARVFVDSLATTVDHIGELKDPIARGAFDAKDIVADYYDLDRFTRQSDDEITLCKNGGGAHLDLMVARWILESLDSPQVK